MNRPLKFRAWDSIKGEWLFGYELPNLGGFSMMGEVMAFGEYQNMLSKYRIGDWDKVILMQYVGLKDKNLKEVYEGDLVRSEIGQLWLIVWDDHMARFCFELQEKKKKFDGRLGKMRVPVQDYRLSVMAVEGNLYENPELIPA